MALITGWGRQTWGEGPWGEAAPVVLTGFEATGSLGTVAIVALANIYPDGQEATAAVNGVGVNAQAVAVVPSLDGQLGTVTVQIQA